MISFSDSFLSNNLPHQVGSVIFLSYLMLDMKKEVEEYTYLNSQIFSLLHQNTLLLSRAFLRPMLNDLKKLAYANRLIH